MSLDDRLRRAHQNQLEDVKQRVDVETSRRSITAGRASAPGFLVAAAAVILLLGGAGLLIRNAVRSSNPTVGIEAGTAGDSSVAPSVDSVQVDGDDSQEPDPTTTEPTDDGPTVTVSVPDGDQVDESADGTTTSTAVASTDAGDDPATLSAGVPNEVCPSGQRAELELAALRYVGENQGWGRLFDLVDEQDGPHYYQAWEPGYPDPVTVELVLADPVLATEIRVAQDPFTPVDGDILIEAAGEQITITLEGTEGWKRHVFAEPTRLDRFTIRREAMTSNIMEVVVCVSPPG